MTSACCGRFTELRQTCPALRGRKHFIASNSWGRTAGALRKCSFPWVWEWGKNQTLTWRNESEAGCCRAGQVRWEQDGGSRSAATLLQGEQENHADKTHPHSTQSALQRGNQGTEGYKAKQCPCAGEKGNFKPQHWPLRLASPFSTGISVV